MAILHFACQEFGWSVEYTVDDVSLIMLMLLCRQKLNTEGKCLLTLEDKERIDNIDWDTLVRQSHERLAKI